MIRFAAIACALCLASAALAEVGADSPGLANSPIDAHAEVAAVLYAASATQAATARFLDTQLRAQRDRINTLAAELNAGNSAHRAEMTAAQESFIAALEQKDRQYAAQIDLFRSAVTDIASTPAGASALERFNAGDEVGAIGILDQIHAANEAMRETRAKLEDAAEGRRIARLALEARKRGKLTTQAVATRFETVVKLDPGVVNDWQSLCELYSDAGQMNEAKQAADAMIAAAHNDIDRAEAHRQMASVLQAQGDFTAARIAVLQAIEIQRRLSAAEPNNGAAFFALSRSQIAFGEIAIYQGDLLSAKRTYVELVAATRTHVLANPADAQTRRLLASDLLHLADVLLKLGDTPAARSALEEDIDIETLLSEQDPGNNLYLRQRDVAWMWLSDVLRSQGHFDEARKINAQIVETATKLCASDPANATLQRDLVFGYLKTALISRIQGNYPETLDMYEHASQITHQLAEADTGKVERWDIATILQEIGDVKFLQNDYDGSRKFYEDSIAVLRSSEAADATDVTSRRSLAVSLYGAGTALTASKDYRGARAAIEEGLALDRALLGKTPDSVDVQSDLADGELASGKLLNLQGKHAAALSLLTQSLDIERRHLAAHPGDSEQERAVAYVMRELADTPGSKVGWADFGTQVKGMEAKGILWPADHVWLDEIQQHDPAQKAH